MPSQRLGTLTAGCFEYLLQRAEETLTKTELSRTCERLLGLSHDDTWSETDPLRTSTPPAFINRSITSMMMINSSVPCASSTDEYHLGDDEPISPTDTLTLVMMTPSVPCP